MNINPLTPVVKSLKPPKLGSFKTLNKFTSCNVTWISVWLFGVSIDIILYDHPFGCNNHIPTFKSYASNWNCEFNLVSSDVDSGIMSNVHENSYG